LSNYFQGTRELLFRFLGSREHYSTFDYNFIYYEQKVKQANKYVEKLLTYLGIKGTEQKFLGSKDPERRAFQGTSCFINREQGIKQKKTKKKTDKEIMGTCTSLGGVR